MNSRLLVGLSDDPKDDDTLTITSYHLKFGRAIGMLPSSADKIDEADLTDIKIAVYDSWIKRKHVQQQSYLRWQDEYLASLSKYKRANNKEIKKGDVALIIT